MFLKRQFGWVVTLLLLSGVLYSASAAEYRFDPSVNLRGFMDDNLLLSSEGREIETLGMNLSPRLKFKVTGDDWRYSIDSRLGFIRMEDDQFNSDDQDIKFEALRATPKTIWQVNARIDRESTRTTDLNTIGVVDFDAERRDAQSLRPVVQWLLSERNRLVFGASAENVHYDALVFDDYDYYGADVAWEHQYSEKTVFSLSGFTGSYEAQSAKQNCDGAVFPTGFNELADFESDSYGLQAGFRHQPSEQLNFGATVGHRDVSSTALSRSCFFFIVFPIFNETVLENDSTGLVLDANISYEGEKYSIAANGGRSVTPAGLGFLIEKNELNAHLQYELAERLTGDLRLYWFDSEAVDDPSLFNRKGYHIQPSLSWRMAEQWRLEGGLRYRDYTVTSSTLDRDGIQIFFGVNYNFKPTVISR